MVFDHQFRSSCLILFAWFNLLNVRALTLNTPTATSTSAPHYLEIQGLSQPRPTHLRYAPEIFARQQATLATCGYINGAESYPVTCGPSLYCATTSTFVGCCETDNCRNIFTSCYDLLGDTCDQACQNNPQNLVCPTSLQYCAEYLYEGGSLGLGCASIRGYTSSVLLTIADGFTTLSTPTPSTNTTVAPTTTSTPDPTPASSSGGLSTGATAGIAVGATLAGVGLGLLAWFLIRRNKKKNKTKAGMASTATPETSRIEPTQPDNRFSAYSELAGKPTSPVASPETPNYQYNGNPSPGLNNPPQYSPHYDGHAVEMPGDTRPQSYAPTELSSNR